MNNKTIFILLTLLFLQISVNAQESCTKTECPLETSTIKKCTGEKCVSFSPKTHVIVRKASKCELENAALKKRIAKLESEKNILVKNLEDVSAKLYLAQNKPTQTLTVTKERIVVMARKLKKNNLTVLVGNGPVGVDGKLSGNKVEADLKRDTVGAIQYTRKFDLLSGTLQLQSNDSVLFGLGLEF